MSGSHQASLCGYRKENGHFIMSLEVVRGYYFPVFPVQLMCWIHFYMLAIIILLYTSPSLLMHPTIFQKFLIFQPFFSVDVFCIHNSWLCVTQIVTFVCLCERPVLVSWRPFFLPLWHDWFWCLQMSTFLHVEQTESPHHNQWCC